MRGWRVLIAMAAALVCTPGANAQAGAYGMFTGGNFNAAGSAETRIWGPTIGIYADFPTPVVKFGGDVRAAFLNGGGLRNYYAVTGPRLEVDLPVILFRPYVEALVGGGDSVADTTHKTALHIDYEGLIGVDHRLIPRLDWRVLEFSYSGSIYGAGTIHTKSLSTGLVLRLP